MTERQPTYIELRSAYEKGLNRGRRQGIHEGGIMSGTYPRQEKTMSKMITINGISHPANLVGASTPEMIAELFGGTVQDGIARHDGEVKAAALREAADAVLHNTADPVYVGDSSEYARGYRQGLRDAARALRRKAKQGDERCTSCGCELAYPTAVHLLDCRLTEKGQGDE